MTTKSDHRTGPFGQAISATEEDVTEQVINRLAVRKAALIRDFPPDPHRYVEFLRTLGTPLDNYGAGSGKAAYALHPNINVVRCAPGTASGARVQEQGGPLPPHSARAFSARRPRFIAMFMINSGWPEQPGSAGESVIVRWTDALRHLREADPGTYARDYALLFETPITITAAHVVDEWATTPLIYPLANAETAADVGVRYSLALWDQLATMPMEEELRSRYRAAVTRLTTAASDPAVRFTYPMQAGHIVILDNNRYGHGRLTFTQARPGENGVMEVNPRELWSVVVD
jgi:hypothetical protein